MLTPKKIKHRKWQKGLDKKIFLDQVTYNIKFLRSYGHINY